VRLAHVGGLRRQLGLGHVVLGHLDVGLGDTELGFGVLELPLGEEDRPLGVGHILALGHRHWRKMRPGHADLQLGTGPGRAARHQADEKQTNW